MRISDWSSDVGSSDLIASGDGVIALEAPYRALDAATVPVVVTAQIPQTEDRYIKSLTLVVTDNPAPIVGTFHFSPANGISSDERRGGKGCVSQCRSRW